MNILERLIKIIDDRSGQQIRKEFQDLFESSGFGKTLHLPLLGIQENSMNNIERQFTNEKSTKAYLSVLCDTKSVKTLRDAFNLFVSAASHSNPIGHFRSYPRYYAQVYAGARYFAFHGDGNCFAISMIFQGFIKKVLSKNIAVCWGTLPDRSYMHTYCMYKDLYVDADQKTFCTQKEIRVSKPKGFIYSLLSFAGFDIYNAYTEDRKARLFSKMTHEFLKDFYVIPQPEIYQDIPSLLKLEERFKAVFSQYADIVSLDKDDYPWKKGYRRSIDFFEYKCPFFSNIEAPFYIAMPPESSLTIGFNGVTLPGEVIDMACIYFGRIPGILIQTIESHIMVKLESPEFPWLIAFDNYFDDIVLNGLIFKPCISQCGQFGILGMGDLEGVTDFSKKEFCYTIQLTKKVEVKTVFPVNEQAIHSGFVKIQGPETMLKEYLC